MKTFICISTLQLIFFEDFVSNKNQKMNKI